MLAWTKKNVDENNLEEVRKNDIPSSLETHGVSNSGQGVSLKVTDKKFSSDIQAVRYRELRQLEAMLKKWEDEIKLRDALLNDKEGDRKKFDDYLQRTEARNVEIDVSIRTLYRKISLLEANGKQAPVVNGSPDYGQEQHLTITSQKYTMPHRENGRHENASSSYAQYTYRQS